MWKLCLQHSVQRVPKLVNCYRRQITDHCQLLGTVVAQLLLPDRRPWLRQCCWLRRASKRWLAKSQIQGTAPNHFLLSSQYSFSTFRWKKENDYTFESLLVCEKCAGKGHLNVQLDCISSLLAIFWSDLISWLLGGCSTNNARVWLHLIAIDVGLQYMKSPQKSSICQFSQNYFWIYFSIFHYAAISVGGVINNPLPICQVHPPRCHIRIHTYAYSHILIFYCLPKDQFTHIGFQMWHIWGVVLLSNFQTCSHNTSKDVPIL